MKHVFFKSLRGRQVVQVFCPNLAVTVAGLAMLLLMQVHSCTWLLAPLPRINTAAISRECDCNFKKKYSKKAKEMQSSIYPTAMALLRSVMSYPDFLLILIFCFHI